jgi:predicted HAD superfamily Cof-like phosphohydrolase
MEKQISQVEEFHKAFNQPVLYAPMLPSVERCLLRQRLLEEEVKELEQAWRNDDIVEAADAITDCLYILFGTAHEFGLGSLLVECFNEVQRSNMSKLDDDGNPIYRPDGKVIKSNNYKRPDLKSIVK